MEPVPILTVGDLKSELSRRSDDTSVRFYSPLREQELDFTTNGQARLLIVCDGCLKYSRFGRLPLETGSICTAWPVISIL
jgi:hypothetical protein